MYCKTRFLLFFTLQISLLTFANSNLLLNGGFEAITCSDECTFDYQNRASFINWQIVGSVDTLRSSINPYEGINCVDLCGYDSGSISQNVSTIPEQVYSLTFQHSGNTFNIPIIKTLVVTVSSSKSIESATFLFNSTGRTLPNPGWFIRNFTFMATDTITQIIFSCIDGTNSGSVLDAINLDLATSLSIITNNNFETVTCPNASCIFNTGSSSLNGWSVTGSVKTLDNTLFSPVSGTRSLDVCGSGNGSVSQTISTTIGRVYLLKFYLAANSIGAPTLKTLRVSFGNNIQIFTTNSSAWRAATISVVASATTTTIQFWCIDGTSFGTVIDNLFVYVQNTVVATTSPISTGEVTSSPLTTSPLTSARLTTSPLTTARLTTSPLTTSPITSGDITTSPLTTSPLTTSPITSGDITTSPLTSAEMTTSPLTTAELTTSPVTSAEMTTSPLTSAEVSTGLALQTTGTVTTSDIGDNIKSSSSSGKGSEIAPIVGGTIGGLALISIAGIIFFVLKRKSGKMSPMIDVELPESPKSTLKEIKDVVLKKKLGEGSFGAVYYALWHGAPVAAKKLKGEDEWIAFQREASLLENMSHPNVIQYLGVWSDPKGEKYIITDYMNKGSLLDVLQKEKVTLRQQYNISMQCCRALVHLEKAGTIHRDIAARNFLASAIEGSSLYQVKIADFGMARQLMLKEHYSMSEGSIPVRWCAPETLSKGIFSIKTDVWSFGVLVWEIFNFGNTPYNYMSNKEVAISIPKGERLIQGSCPEDVYQILLKCWASEPDARPSFESLLDEFEKLNEKHTATSSTAMRESDKPVESKSNYVKTPRSEPEKSEKTPEYQPMENPYNTSNNSQ